MSTFFKDVAQESRIQLNLSSHDNKLIDSGNNNVNNTIANDGGGQDDTNDTSDVTSVDLDLSISNDTKEVNHNETQETSSMRSMANSSESKPDGFNYKWSNHSLRDSEVIDSSTPAKIRIPTKQPFLFGNSKLSTKLFSNKIYSTTPKSNSDFKSTPRISSSQSTDIDNQEGKENTKTESIDYGYTSTTLKQIESKHDLIKVAPVKQISSTVKSDFRPNDSLSNSFFNIITELESKCTSYKYQLTKSNQVISVKENELQAMQGKVTTVTQKLNSLNSILNEFASELKEMKTDKSERSNYIEEIKSDLETTQKSVQHLKERLSKTTKYLESYKLRSNGFKLKFEKQNLLIKTLEASVDELSGNLSEEKIKVCSLNNKLNETSELYAKQLIEKQDQSFNLLNDKIDKDLKVQIVENSKQVSSHIENVFDQFSKSFETSVLGKLAAESNQLQTQLKEYTTSTFESINLIKNSIQSIDEVFPNSISDISSNFKTMLETVNNLQDSSLKDKFAAIKKDANFSTSELKQMLTSLSVKLEEQLTNNNSWNSSISELSNQIKVYQDEKLKITQELKDAAVKILNFEKLFETQKLQSSSKTTEIKNLKANVIKLEKDLKQKVSKLDEVSQTAEHEKQELTKNFKTSIASLKEFLAIANNEKIQNISERDTLTKKIKELEKIKADYEILKQSKREIKQSATELEILKMKTKTNESNYQSEIAKITKKYESSQKELLKVNNKLTEKGVIESSLNEKIDKLTKQFQTEQKNDYDKRIHDDQIRNIGNSLKESNKKFTVKEAKYKNDIIGFKEKIKMLEIDNKSQLKEKESLQSSLSNLENQLKKSENEKKLLQTNFESKIKQLESRSTTKKLEEPSNSDKKKRKVSAINNDNDTFDEFSIANVDDFPLVPRRKTKK
ncbi:hypothetical protein DFJ63DRAFT_193951 [Scheffersomyces coipomensis]|uniref:uncharacterized protein n=1 Tax=Scheffersomyces coipomensis TaxID=1788519 RepID=UPI00315DDB06